jgi:hypothetical protein
MGSFWKGAWEGSGSGEFWVFLFSLVERFGGFVSLGLRSGGCRKKNREEEEEGTGESKKFLAIGAWRIAGCWIFLPMRQ